MGSIEKKDDDISIFIEDREYIANTYVLRCIFVTMFIFSGIFLLNVAGIFVIEQSLMRKAYISALTIYLIIYLTSKHVSLSDEKNKYFFLLGSILINTVIGVFVTYHAVLLPIMPFLYATLYSSKKVMKYVYMLTVFSTVVIVYGGFYYGLCDANMALLTCNNLQDYLVDGQFALTAVNSNPYVTLMLFFAMPRCLIYIAFGFVCNNIYKVVCGSIEKAKISAELEKAKEDAENANKAKSQFLTRMSHEIRTPINAVLGMNEMILRESMEPETRKYAHDIKGSAKALLSLINEILDYSKIESGKIEIIPDNYEISSMFHDLYNMMSIRANDKGIDLKFDIDPNIPCEYYGDDIRIRQVLVNLLTNGLKYTIEGTVTMSVTGKIEGENAILHYSVKDTGIGIKEEDLGKLFVQFERIEESRNRNIEGTGLGMNICAQLLRLMGSDLKVESEYGKGSEFYFDIVQKVTNFEPLGDFHKRIFSTDTEYECDKNYVAEDAKVLVVDDNEINRKVFRNLLKRNQIKVYEAESGEECLAILERQKFDIIFLDYMMPIMDGVETLHEIKDRDLCGDTPVIMLTANAIVGAREEFLNEGFDDYLTKPIAPDKLDMIVLNYLSKDLVSEVDCIKEEEHSGGNQNLPQLEEFDFDYAMNILKSEELILITLKDFYTFMERLPGKLSRLFDAINQEEIRALYKIEVHALKSTAATVGALILSKLARMLEVAAVENNVERITVLHPVLLDEIEKHKKRIATIMQDPEDKVVLKNLKEILPYLDMLKVGIENDDYDTADVICDEISKYVYPAQIQTMIDEIASQVTNLEACEAIINIDKLKMKVEG
ncbi:MAG: response regulator [Lachnospiraceae bacterium]|nr:response regulator [Lachnospiraceae bacterium]